QITECGSDLATLLAECPRLKILATSREPLQIRAEWRFDLKGLERGGGVESSAAQLFIHRARQILPAFAPSQEEQRAIQRIADLVAGNALALELAATWLRFYDCAAIAAEIERGVDFLESDLRDVPRRHRSIRVLFDHSWQLLAPEEQRALRQLSVLRGEWTLAQGSAVAEGTPRELVRLSDKSLVRRSGVRYTIDELVRQFAFEHLQEEELQRVQRRSAAFFLQGLARQHHALQGMEPQAARAALRADW